jgi:hypothetical protein
MPSAKERLGYPTQKPLVLLERIIKASSNKGDIIFDPFCGCGTSVYAAHLNNRKWIGCDIAILAIQLVQDVLKGRYNLSEGSDYTVDGIPVTVEQAIMLFEQDPFQFQHWAIEYVGGFCTNKKTQDQGIDGRIYYETPHGLKDMVLSVKGGHIGPTDIRDLKGVMERERSSMAGFISIKEPTKAMIEEAGKAGMFDYNGIKYPKIQLLTIRKMLDEDYIFRIPNRVWHKGKIQYSFAY